MRNIRISKTTTFEASHVLPKHPGKCSRLHGHSWELTVTVEGPVNKETGFVCDYGELKKVINQYVIDVVDHRHLGHRDLHRCTSFVRGEITITMTHDAVLGLDFYPSSENLVIAFAKMLLPPINELNVQLVEVSLSETCTCKATWSVDHE